MWFIEINMFKAVLRVLITAVMLVVFVGQAMAYNTSITCETSVVSHASSNHNESVNHNDSKSTNTNSSVDCCDIDCCDVYCICIAHAFSYFAYFNIEVYSTKIAILSNTFYIQKSKQPISIPTLPYRPPIFTS